VTVLAVDLDRKRISLSMKKEPDQKPTGEPKTEGKNPRGKPPARKEKRGPAPFNNPFIQAFKRQK
jgi:transcriptional accessory protein Tex/SPT6